MKSLEVEFVPPTISDDDAKFWFNRHMLFELALGTFDEMTRIQELAAEERLKLIGAFSLSVARHIKWQDMHRSVPEGAKP